MVILAGLGAYLNFSSVSSSKKSASHLPNDPRTHSRFLLRAKLGRSFTHLSPEPHAWAANLWDMMFATESYPTVKTQDVFLVIMIASAPANTRQRGAIRSTWGHPTGSGFDQEKFLTIFLVGDSDDPSRRRLVLKEAKEYGDMLVGPYVDTYRNLTLKTVHGFLWITEHVKPSFVLKTDDDCFVNIGVLADVLAETLVFQTELSAAASGQEDSTYRMAPGHPEGAARSSSSALSYRGAALATTRLPSPFYVGNIRWSNPVVRNPKSRWYVPEEDYARSRYPPYGSGAGYILDSRALDVLTSNVRRVKPFANEDAYVGTVLSEAGVYPVQSSRFASQLSGLWTCNFLYFVVIHGVSAEDHGRLVAKVQSARQQCRDVERDVGWD
ncbi:hypothetical protein HPB48_023013 [Haemaphysalis longicornis]|uniref:Hexosyltransferase n=1 Tax=Haemaphysalis longicornis TaxID=44386 RepID=A0A9J6GNR5_HAELO|nr:hypothetical protein HPB48_023013 [Haemaphysalis longicornis]